VRYYGWTVPQNLQAQPGTVGILRLEESHRAAVTISDLQTLQPYPACPYGCGEITLVQAYVSGGFARP
jgi:hypothetical protein